MAIEFSFTSDAVRTEPSVDILLVQRDQRRVQLTLGALERHHLANRVHVVREASEALEFLFCSGAYADRSAENPRLVLIDLDVALAGNLDLLRQVRRDALTGSVPVIVLACSASDRVTAMAVFREHELEVPVTVIDGTAHDDEIAYLPAAGAESEDFLTASGEREKMPAPARADDVRRDRDLESLTRIARGMAHEFNNLFSVVVAYTELLLRDLDPDDARRDGADAVFKSIARANKLARQLLTFTADATRVRASAPAGPPGSPRPARRPGNTGGAAR